MATALLENGSLNHLKAICEVVIRRGLGIEPLRALLFVPISKAQHIERGHLLDQLRNYEQLVKFSSSANAEVQALIYYAKGSFETTLKQPDDALRSFISSIKLNSQISRYPMLWSQTANLFFWKGQWNAAAYHYLLALRLQGDRHWETKGNFADTQWRRGALGSALFWLRQVIDDPEAAKDARFGWFRFLRYSVQWAKDFTGGSRFIPNSELAATRLSELDDGKREATLNVLKDLVKLDFARVELWERLVDEAEQSQPESAIRLEMMATACDYANSARWASLVIRSVCSRQVDEDCRTLIVETALSIDSDAIATAIRVFADYDGCQVPAGVLHQLADQFESAPRRELSRYIRPMELESEF